ncbi:MAG: hypothetical protein ABH819_02695 [Patescibacteria group bacterium]
MCNKENGVVSPGQDDGEKINTESRKSINTIHGEFDWIPDEVKNHVELDDGKDPKPHTQLRPDSDDN